MTNWVYVEPEALREQLGMYEREVAAIKMALGGVAQGHFVLLGDGPHGPRYTGPRQVEDPLLATPDRS
jgi:hypothetical protein